MKNTWTRQIFSMSQVVCRLIPGVLTLCLLVAGPVFADSRIAQRLRSVTKGHPELALSVAKVSGGVQRMIFGLHEDAPKIPASVMKLVTTRNSLAVHGALKQFNLDFRQDSNGRLLISGDGDPSLTTEKLWIIARELKHAGIREVSGVVIDRGLGVIRKRTNTNPYGAPVSLLSLNYNSRAFVACVTPAGKRVVSAEPFEYHPKPLSRLASGKNRISAAERKDAAGEIVQGRLSKGCKRDYLSVSDPLEYFGKTLQGFLGYLGVAAHGAVSVGDVGQKGHLLYRHRSIPLSEIIQLMNLYSNNIIAEQLTALLAPAAPTAGKRYQAGLKRSLSLLKRNFKMKPALQLHDGSGLNRDNRLTTSLINSVIGNLVIDSRDWVDFLASLPSAARSGTLKNWNWNASWGDVRAKTGTLNGVRSLAGVVRDRCSNFYTFASFQVPASKSAIALEQRIVRTIATADCGA